MLLTPRSYISAQVPDTNERSPKTREYPFFQQTRRFDEERALRSEARKMLLVHQAGQVKIGEVVRYTLTYTPNHDRILPTPSHLHVKVKNTSAIPLRAAWIHGPYALHVSAYPESFNPHCKVEEPKRYGVPEYEPMLKAAGSWQTKLTVPDDIRETGADLGKRRQSTQSQTQRQSEDDQPKSVTWIIEIASQILFSSSAGVDFELLVGRDERSLDLGFTSLSVAGQGQGGPGQVKDAAKQRQRLQGDRHHHNQTSGVFSKAVRLVVEDTEALWNKPGMPTWNDNERRSKKASKAQAETGEDGDKLRTPKKRKMHLVIVTHGLHSNVGADMLFMKESIDATVRQARVDARERKRKYRAQEREQKNEQNNSESTQESNTHKSETDDDVTATAPLSGGQEDIDDEEEDEDEEETIVRGFSGNAARTENGIQYLGKRLAKYILKLTYPDQPFLPVKKPLSRTLTDSFKTQATKAQRDGTPAHQGSSVHHSKEQQQQADELPYTFSSISFIGHSLGGLIQTYAVAYIQKHSPTFFEQIEPVNFVCMASPMLGLSNENPLYVKFALDFGLVGRTGQDLGLTWKPPGLASARGGWNAMIGGLGGSAQKNNDQGEDPGAKPLLRILPTGPAHQVLRKFRNRTLYSNVVNDGIVPLRTSCLLFLDWRGLGKVDKARRENGLVGTAAGWAWAELTGANSSSVPPNVLAERNLESDSDTELARRTEGQTVPQPAEDETAEDSRKVTGRMSFDSTTTSESKPQAAKEPPQQKGVFDSFFDWFRPSPAPTPPRGNSPQPSPQPKVTRKTSRALHRAQTIRANDESPPDDEPPRRPSITSNPTIRPQGNNKPAKRPVATRGDSLVNTETGELQAPPKTSIFESAGDILHPPLPSKQWITDPSSRARTIFHDRVYHPEDIPPPPLKRTGSKLGRTFSSDNVNKSGASSANSLHSVESVASIDSGGMKVEEKIARAYHKDLSWRKVLVRLEPDAHNNMIVRRQFANAYGWPVIKHLCDTHFADTYSARTRDEAEPAKERAPHGKEPIDSQRGEEVAYQTRRAPPPRTDSESREAQDELTALSASHQGSESSKHRAEQRASGVWDDAIFEGPDDDDSEIDERGLIQRLVSPGALKRPEQSYQPTSPSARSPRSPSFQFTDGHRGLAPLSPTSSKSKSARGPESGSLRSRASLKSTAEPGDGPDEEPVVAKNLTEEPDSLEQGSSLADVGLGLGKNVQEGLGSPTQSARARRASVAEDVARASAGGGQE